MPTSRTPSRCATAYSLCALSSPVSRKVFRMVLQVGLALCLLACQPLREPPPTVTAPATDWPPFDYAAIESADTAVYALDAVRSRVDVVVHPDGPLAKFGHDHVIVLGAPRGFLFYPGELSQARADLRFAVTGIQVDPPQARARHALESQLDSAAIAGTRDNLMQHVLEPQHWPWIDISLTDFREEAGQLSALLDISVNGQRAQLRRSFVLDRAGGEVRVTGSLQLQQLDLGLQPFAALGGGLRVAQDMEVYFELHGALSNQAQGASAADFCWLPACSCAVAGSRC